MNHRHFSVMAIVLLISLLIFSAGNQKPLYVNALGDSDDEPLRVSICTDDNDRYTAYVRDGFCDAIKKSFPDKLILFAEQKLSESPAPSTALETLIQTRPDLLFTYGDSSLSAAAELTTTIPIVFGGVMNYRSLLHLVPGSDNVTGRNITGISAVPCIDEQLSLLIEACNYNPHAVGILYDPTDADAILQNEILENFLDDAGIPWREYEIQNEIVSQTEETYDPNSSLPQIPFPSITAAASGKEGANIHPDSIGESGDLTGINEPKSARSPKTSSLWNNPESPETTGLSQDEILSVACNECDVLYLCAQSKICTDQAKLSLIRQRALDNGIITVGGDAVAGEQTTVCLYEDPYDMGYRCGLQSVRIINEEDDIRHMTIGSSSADACTKLYQTDISEALGKTWPKSFYEYYEYLDSYIPGKLTDTEE